MQIYLHFFINKSETGLLVSKLTRLLFMREASAPRTTHNYYQHTVHIFPHQELAG